MGIPVKNSLLLWLLLLASTAYGLHKLVLSWFYLSPQQNFVYPLEQLYLFFAGASLFICALLWQIRRKEINNVGFTFLLLTFAKMGIAGYFIQPVLAMDNPLRHIEKFSYFVVFIVFLAIETLLTIKMLNKK